MSEFKVRSLKGLYGSLNTKVKAIEFFKDCFLSGGIKAIDYSFDKSNLWRGEQHLMVLLQDGAYITAADMFMYNEYISDRAFRKDEGFNVEILSERELFEGHVPYNWVRKILTQKHWEYIPMPLLLSLEHSLAALTDLNRTVKDNLYAQIERIKGEINGKAAVAEISEESFSLGLI